MPSGSSGRGRGAPEGRRVRQRTVRRRRARLPGGQHVQMGLRRLSAVERSRRRRRLLGRVDSPAHRRQARAVAGGEPDLGNGADRDNGRSATYRERWSR